MISLPENLYVGRLKRDNENILGFMVPDGTDRAAQKRKESVDSWAGGRSWKNKDAPLLEPLLLKNTAMKGFKLTDTIRRCGYNGSGNVLWRVLDPRDFEIEISSDNLAGILDSVGVLAGGAIPGDCIWGREGSRNVLLPLTSEPYRLAAQVDAKPVKEKPANLKIGHVYETTQMGPLLYLGKTEVTLCKGKGGEVKTFFTYKVLSTIHTHELALLKNPPLASYQGEYDEKYLSLGPLLQVARLYDIGMTVSRKNTKPPLPPSTYPCSSLYTSDYEYRNYLRDVEAGRLIRIEEDDPLWHDDHNVRSQNGYHDRAKVWVRFPYEQFWSGDVVDLKEVP